MESTNHGLNILGYTEATSGLGEAVRLNIRAAEKIGIPLNVIDYEKVKHKAAYEYKVKYPVNLVQITLHDLDRFFSVIDPEFFIGRYSILFLIWESEYIPAKLKTNVNLFNEIWTASGYCNDLFQKVYDGPILTVPHPVEVALQPIDSKNAPALLDRNKFSFLFVFSYHSSVERKNPLFLMEAFADNYEVELLIKTSGAEKFRQAERKLKAIAANHRNIKLVNKEMDKDSLDHLINDSDCYVSMHHSEGFGLTLAEAMCLGKPTIATNYSGNTEFMDQDNSFLVDCELGPIKNPDSNFSYKTIWAHPSMQDAVTKLQQVYSNTDLRQQKASNAKLSVKEKLSFEAVGTIMKNRLDQVYDGLEEFTVSDRRQAFLLNQLQQAKSEIAQLKNEMRRMKKNLIIRFILALKQFVRKLKGKK